VAKRHGTVKTDFVLTIATIAIVGFCVVMVVFMRDSIFAAASARRL